MKKQFFYTLDYLLLNGNYLVKAIEIFHIILWYGEPQSSHKFFTEDSISISSLLEEPILRNSYSAEDIEKFKQFLLSMPEVLQLKKNTLRKSRSSLDKILIPNKTDFLIRNIGAIQAARDVYKLFDSAAYNRAVIGHSFLKKAYPILITVTIILGLLSPFSIIAKILFVLFFILCCLNLLIFIYIPRPSFFIKREDYE